MCGPAGLLRAVCQRACLQTERCLFANRHVVCLQTDRGDLVRFSALTNRIYANGQRSVCKQGAPTVCKQTEHRTRSLVPAFTRCIHGRRGRPLRRHRRETQAQLLTPWQRRRNADKQAFPIREYETRSRSREHVSFGEQRMPLACHGSWDSSAPPPAGRIVALHNERLSP